MVHSFNHTHMEKIAYIIVVTFGQPIATAVEADDARYYEGYATKEEALAAYKSTELTLHP